MARIGRMTNSITAIKPERLAQYAKDFNADRANLVAANAAVSSGVLEAATDYKGQRALPRDFSIELKQGSITNQRRSGRCWMFASLNTLRYELMHQWGLDDFEFSETYLFFWGTNSARRRALHKNVGIKPFPAYISSIRHFETREFLTKNRLIRHNWSGNSSGKAPPPQPGDVSWSGSSARSSSSQARPIRSG